MDSPGAPAQGRPPGLGRRTLVAGLLVAVHALVLWRIGILGAMWGDTYREMKVEDQSGLLGGGDAGEPVRRAVVSGGYRWDWACVAALAALCMARSAPVRIAAASVGYASAPCLWIAAGLAFGIDHMAFVSAVERQTPGMEHLLPPDPTLRDAVRAGWDPQGWLRDRNASMSRRDVEVPRER